MQDSEFIKEFDKFLDEVDARKNAVWKTYEGKYLTMEEITDQHLANIIAWVTKNASHYSLISIDNFKEEAARRGLSEEFLSRTPYPHLNRNNNLVTLTIDGNKVSETKVKTLFLYDSTYRVPYFFVLDGDYSHLNKTYANQARAIQKNVDELYSLMFDENDELKVTRHDEPPIRDWTHFVLCGAC